MILAPLLAITIAAFAAINILGALPLDTDPPGTRLAKRTVRRYRNAIDGKPYTHRIVYGSRFVRAMIRLKIFPAKRAGWTPTPSGLLRDELGVADLDTLLHEIAHGLQQFDMPRRWVPDFIEWPIYYFANQDQLEANAKEWAAWAAEHGTAQTTLTLDPRIFIDGVIRERRAA